MSFPRSVTVTAASRLHFGLFAFDASGGGGRRPSFGGAGMMIEEPHVCVRACEADRLSVSGPASDRAAAVVARLVDAGLLAEPPRCRLEVVDAPPQHGGLGVGTQLSLAVAVAVLRSQGITPPDAVALAALLGRGRRSAIGTHGFASGGLLVDAGKRSADSVAPLAARVALPPEWRVLLLLPAQSQSLSGDAEERAFAQLPPISSDTSGELRRLATDEIVPAAAASQFERFAAAVSRFNAISGDCFAAVQGGPYASPVAARWVRRLGELGAPAGQSSWGPTLFAFAPDEQHAATLEETIRSRAIADGWRPRVVRPAVGGARIDET
ncbi:MAG: hypothetical protein WD875_05495 [Pirellulales bacterium]